MTYLGLRGKSFFALGITGIFALLFALGMGALLLSDGKAYLAENYARNFTDLNYRNILSPVSKELRRAEQFANGATLKRWMMDPADRQKRATFLKETRGYLQAFQDQSLYIVNDESRYHYVAEQGRTLSIVAKLNPDNSEDSWYFQARQQKGYELNVELDENKQYRVWIRYPVTEDNHFLGVYGTGFTLNHFVEGFINPPIDGVQPFIVNASGQIIAHQNKQLIADGDDSLTHSIFDLLDNEPSRKRVRQAMAQSHQNNKQVSSVQVTQSGRPQLQSFMYIPLLDWYVVTNVDLDSVKLLNTDLLVPAAGVMLALLIVIILVFGLAVERLVIAPIRLLQTSATAIADGSYEVTLPTTGRDEIGELSRTFGLMADKIRSHTHELTQKVQERTSQLEQTNQEMAEAQRKINSSLEYASLIQKAILPDREMNDFLQENGVVIWRPRDVVGGDFYVFQHGEEGCLLGIVDCAGHGVPGAMMTMLMRAALDHAIGEVGISDPAALLHCIDDTLRSMLNEDVSANRVATNADVGLVFVPSQMSKSKKVLRFSGAKIGLYACNGDDIVKYRPGRRAIGDRRPGEYQNIDIPAHGWTYYMTTDGFLDQAGGNKSFGFGSRRFENLLKQHAKQSLPEQSRAFTEALDNYMGNQPQRDDITLLSFRFPSSNKE